MGTEDLLTGTIYIQSDNGEYAPAIGITNITEFTVEPESDFAKPRMFIPADCEYTFSCSMSQRGRKHFENACLYGWRNNMPVRKKQFYKAWDMRIRRRSRNGKNKRSSV